MASAMRLASLGWLVCRTSRDQRRAARANSPRRDPQLLSPKIGPLALQRSIHFILIRLAQRLLCGPRAQGCLRRTVQGRNAGVAR